MKKIILLALIILASCSAPKNTHVSKNSYVPKDFDDAERWFDEMHKH
jgi:hypothetical protein